jgi:anti-sigma factor RsiW
VIPLFQHLENESLLLLYMAGELPPEDRAELELLLARDGGLRIQLAALREAQSASYSAMAQLDAADNLRAVEPALRQVDRAILQWQVDRLSRPAKVGSGVSRMPIWAWSGGSAIAALLVFCIWWGFHTDNSHLTVATQPFTTQPDTNQSPDGGLADNAPSPTSPVGPLVNPANNPDANANVVPIVTVDAERIGDLERQVSEDLQ